MKDQAPGKKRQLIAQSNKVMFFWVAGMSAIVGICLVLSYFLWQQLEYRTKVVNKKNETVAVLRSNNNAVEELKNNVRVLQTNSELNSARIDEDENALQVILDALPADSNATALGASLQQKLFADVAGLTVESLSVGATDAATETTDTSGDETTDTSAGTIGFTVVLSSSDSNVLKDALTRLEKSIRVIDIDSLVIARSESGYTMTVEAHAYYEPAKTVELRKEAVAR